VQIRRDPDLCDGLLFCGPDFEEPMKRLALFVLLALAACLPYKPPVVTPPVTPPATMTAHIQVMGAGAGVAGAKADLQTGAADWLSCTTDASGHCYVIVPATLSESQLRITAEGYLPSAQHVDVVRDCTLLVQLQKRPPPDVDPMTVSLEELAAIRGAMWTVPGPWRFGPRPGQPDNITALGFLYSYGADPKNLSDEQKAMLATYKGEGYTHNVFGPPNGTSYHGQYPDTDFTSSPEMYALWLDWNQVFWNHQLKPVVFMHPDGWTFEETKALWERLISYDPVRTKKLLRILVPSGWEPTRYDWSSRTWGLYFKWAHATFPDALILAHTVADVDAMAGTDALYDDNGKGNDNAWKYIAPLIHGWLTQSAAFESPTTVEPSSGRTKFEEWWRMYDRNTAWSYYGRFHNGYAGWPTGSLWGPTTPIKIYAAEYCSYWVYWHGRTYAECQAWGDRAMKVGADGYLDGGSVPVPVIK
jgi:hypothetical protein